MLAGIRPTKRGPKAQEVDPRVKQLEAETCPAPAQAPAGEPYALEYSIATLLNNLYGRGKEPFWQQAYTDLVKFLILLRRIVDGYTTLSDVYYHAIETI